MGNSNAVGNPLLITTSRIRNAFGLLKKKWILIVLAALVGLTLGVIYSLIKKPLYTATLTFSLEGDDKASGSSLMSIAAQFGFDLGGSVGGIFEGDNIVELFKSRKMIETTMLQPYENTGKTYGDIFLDIMNRRPKEAPAKLFPINADAHTFSRLQDSAMGDIYELIAKSLLDIQKPDIHLNMYAVSFKCYDENYTKRFTETIVADVSKFYVDTKTKRERHNVDILQSRTDSIYRAYGSALSGRAGILDANLNPAFQTPLVGAQKKQTDITVLGTAYGELLKNLELAKYTLLKQTPYIQVIDEPRYPLEKKTYPMSFYVPLSVFFFTFLAICGLLGLRLMGNLYRAYIK